MEEIISLVIRGCKLARDLESNLPNLANQPNLLLKSCDEIIRIFSVARDRLNHNPSSSSGHDMFHGELHESQGTEIGAGMQEWLRYNCTQAMDMLHAQILAGNKGVFGAEENKISGPGLEFQVHEVVGRDGEGTMQLRGSTGGEVHQPMGVSDSGRASSSQQRTRRRNDEVDRRTVMVSAPQIGNIEIPPDDHYTWRKYGQKEILGSRFPRSYYRCTHQKLYNCPAKKQVQRLDNDPFTFEVTYRGNHTCHMSSTAPSIPPPPSLGLTQEMNMNSPPSTSIPLARWLSMDIKPTRDQDTITTQMQIYRDHFGTSGIGTTSSGMVGGSSGAGPSTVRYGRDGEYQPVAELADAMFNSGSSSNNSMDLIFSSMEDKWEATDKRQ